MCAGAVYSAEIGAPFLDTNLHHQRLFWNRHAIFTLLLVYDVTGFDNDVSLHIFRLRDICLWTKGAY